MADRDSAYEMTEKTRSGEERVMRVAADELVRLLIATAGEIAGRSKIVTCQACGRRFLVNNPDFHLKRRCNGGFGCQA